jgi:hypothetical protein
MRGPVCMADVAQGHARTRVVSLPRYSDAGALEGNGGDQGTYRRRVATAKGWEEWRRPGAVQGRLGDAPFLPQHLLQRPFLRSDVRANGGGGGLRRSWVAQRGWLGRAEHGSHNGIEREGKRGQGRFFFIRHPRGDHVRGVLAGELQPEGQLRDPGVG